MLRAAKLRADMLSATKLGADMLSATKLREDMLRRAMFNRLKLRNFFGVALWVLALVGCNNANTVTVKADAHVVAFGDSLTSGVGATLGADYPSKLATLTGLNVINAGVSGETTEQGAQRLTQVLDEFDPDVLILLEGGNDFLRNQDITQTKANLAQMIALSQARNIQVILVAVPQKSLFLSDAKLYQQLADDYQISLLPDALADLLGQTKLKSDTVHLNDAGYTQLAEKIAELIDIEP